MARILNDFPWRRMARPLKSFVKPPVKGHQLTVQEVTSVVAFQNAHVAGSWGCIQPQQHLCCTCWLRGKTKTAPSKERTSRLFTLWWKHKKNIITRVITRDYGYNVKNNCTEILSFWAFWGHLRLFTSRAACHRTKSILWVLQDVSMQGAGY